MADPVAVKSTFLCMYMSSHPDTLVAYVTHFCQVKEEVVSASMKSIDSKTMTLSYTLRGSDARHEKQLLFDPPLASYEEVKPRLIAMKEEAGEAIGMIARPTISTFHFPMKAVWSTIPTVVLIYVTYAPPSSPGAVLRDAIGGSAIINWIWVVLHVAHTCEAIYTASLCKRHHTGLGVGALWVGLTFVAGYAAWVELRKRIQSARIASISKAR